MRTEVVATIMLLEVVCLGVFAISELVLNLIFSLKHLVQVKNRLTTHTLWNLVVRFELVLELCHSRNCVYELLTLSVWVVIEICH